MTGEWGKDVPQKRLRGEHSSCKEEVDLGELYLEMARTLALAAEARDPYTYGHSERVALVATEIANQSGCSGELVREIQIAARLHDIGKIAIPDSVLFKPGPLTPAEYGDIKRHPTVAVEIIRCLLEYLEGIIPLIEGHHEWYNGKGYPSKLKGEQIPLGARILAVADAFDAMTCSRPYRCRLSNEEAAQVLKDGAGRQWDPGVIDVFLKVLEQGSRILQALLVET